MAVAINTTCSLMGDIHGKTEELEKFLRSRSEESLILLGDCGFGFVPNYVEIMEKMARENGNHVYCLRGNHDNPSVFKNPPPGEWLHILPDYTELLIQGKRCLAIGGGVSVDRTFRREGKNWWSDETIRWDRERVEALAGKIDILLTHAGLLPPSVKPLRNENPGLFDRDRELHTDLVQERWLFLDLIEKLEPLEWFFGHFHVSETWKVNNRTLCRALAINEIIEI